MSLGTPDFDIVPAPSHVSVQTLAALLRWLEDEAERILHAATIIDASYPASMDRVPIARAEKSAATAEFLVKVRQWVQDALRSGQPVEVVSSTAQPDIVERFRVRG